MRVRELDTFEEASLNLAPLVDVVFLLLIFFMVATTFVEKEAEIGLDLPVAESGKTTTEAPDELVINLLRDGGIKVAGKQVDETALRETLAEAARANPKTFVTIRGDREVVLQRVVGVMDACRLAGLTDIGMLTEPR